MKVSLKFFSGADKVRGLFGKLGTNVTSRNKVQIILCMQQVSLP